MSKTDETSLDLEAVRDNVIEALRNAEDHLARTATEDDSSREEE